jgi:hypothetical protein
MKTIMTKFILSFALVILSGYICKSQAQENSYNSKKSSDTLSFSNDRNSWGAWFHLGLGGTNGQLYNKHDFDEYFTFQAGLNVKYNHYLFTFGLDKSTPFGGVWYIDSYWSTFGYSTNSPHTDVALCVGPSYSKWEYLSEDYLGDINSPWSLGFIIQPQLLIHMRTGVGFGAIFTYNYSEEVKYGSFLVVLAFGVWDR